MFSVFRNINRFANKSKTLDRFAVFCAKYLLYLMIVFLLSFAFAVHNWQIFFYSLFSGLLSAFVLDKIIYTFYKEQRPAYLANAKVLILIPKNPSFPSRHASLLFGMAFYLFFYSTPLAIFFIVLSCLVGISRVFVGVHWFRDILGGAFVGFLSVIIMRIILINW